MPIHGGFTSTIQNPRTADTTGVWGTYQLIVTEKRNGCKDTATKNISMYDVIVLSTEDLTVKGVYGNNSILLTWEDRNQGLAGSYEIEKYAAGEGYQRIGTVLNNGGGNGPFSFTDIAPLKGDNRYRIKAIVPAGQMYYSGVVTVAAANADGLQSIYVAGNAPDSRAMTLVINSNADCPAAVLMYSLSGQRLWDKNVQLVKGMNTMRLPATGVQTGGIQVLFILISGRVVYSQKIMF